MRASSIRYIVNDVDEAVEFYTRHLCFELVMRPAPGFAMLSSGGLRLLLNAADGGGGAGRLLSDGRRPVPGGWNRFQMEVDDLDATVDALRGAGVVFRGDIVDGRGGRQVLAEDPSGNPVELYEPHPR